MTEPLPPTSQLLLCEAIGFSPQLLLDDIINIANNAVQDGVNGMEEFLETWASTRPVSESITQEVEQGLVAFQTLLEYHTDIAFDFFEAWCLRNIFMIPSDLPVVLPHHEGLDLTIDKGREQELMDEIDILRGKLEEQRRMKRAFNLAIRKSKNNLIRAKSRLEQLSFLATSSTLDTYQVLPSKLASLHKAMLSLSPLESSLSARKVSHIQTGKRPWEMGKTGYVNWAVDRLVSRAAQGEGEAEGRLDGPVDGLVSMSESVGDAAVIRNTILVNESQNMDTENA